MDFRGTTLIGIICNLCFKLTKTPTQKSLLRGEIQLRVDDLSPNGRSLDYPFNGLFPSTQDDKILLGNTIEQEKCTVNKKFPFFTKKFYIFF